MKLVKPDVAVRMAPSHLGGGGLSGLGGKTRRCAKKQQREHAHDAGHRMRRQRLEQQRADDDAHQPAGNQKLQKLEVKVFAKRRHAQNVHQQQHRHQNGSGFRHGDGQRHHRHGQRAKARTKAAFAHAQQQHGGNGDGVKVGVSDDGECHLGII